MIYHCRYTPSELLAIHLIHNVYKRAVLVARTSLRVSVLQPLVRYEYFSRVLVIVSVLILYIQSRFVLLLKSVQVFEYAI